MCENEYNMDFVLWPDGQTVCVRNRIRCREVRGGVKLAEAVR